MSLTYGGIPLHVATPEETAWVERYISVRDVYELNYPAWPSCWHSPPPGQIPYDRITIGRLWWPVGASRWAVGHFLASETAIRALRPLIYVPTGENENYYQPLELVMGAGENRTIAPDLYMLPPRPLAQFANGNGLHLVTLVDARYFWWVKATAIGVTENTTTWAQLYAAIEAALDISIAFDDINEAYLLPSGLLAQPPNQFIPPLLDAAAASIGQRIVRNLDGTVITQNARTAAASTTPFTAGKISGGLFAFDPTSLIGHDLNALVPDSVSVSFPAPDPGDPYTVAVSLVDLDLPEYPEPITGYRSTKSLSCTAVADDDDQDNLDIVATLAEQIATDFYLWQLGYKDVKFSGIIPLTLDALHEVCWDYTKDEMTTRVQRTCWNDFGAVSYIASDLGSTTECCEIVGNDIITINLTTVTSNTVINPGPATKIILIADSPYLIVPGIKGGKPGRKIEIWIQGNYPIIFPHNSLIVAINLRLSFPALHTIYALPGWKLELTWLTPYWRVVTWPSEQIVKITGTTPVDFRPPIGGITTGPIPLIRGYNASPTLTLEDVPTKAGDLLAVPIFYRGTPVSPTNNTCLYNGLPMTLVHRQSGGDGRLEVWKLPITADTTANVVHTIADDTGITRHAGASIAIRGLNSPTISAFDSYHGSSASTTHTAGTVDVAKGDYVYAAIGYIGGTHTGIHGIWQDFLIDFGEDIIDSGNLILCEGFGYAVAASTLIARKEDADSLTWLGIVLVISGTEASTQPCEPEWANVFPGVVQFVGTPCDRMLSFEPIWAKRFGNTIPDVDQRFIARHVGQKTHPDEDDPRALYALMHRCCEPPGGSGPPPCEPGDDCFEYDPPPLPPDDDWFVIDCCNDPVSETFCFWFTTNETEQTICGPLRHGEFQGIPGWLSDRLWNTTVRYSFRQRLFLTCSDSAWGMTATDALNFGESAPGANSGFFITITSIEVTSCSPFEATFTGAIEWSPEGSMGVGPPERTETFFGGISEDSVCQNPCSECDHASPWIGYEFSANTLDGSFQLAGYIDVSVSAGKAVRGFGYGTLLAVPGEDCLWRSVNRVADWQSGDLDTSFQWELTFASNKWRMDFLADNVSVGYYESATMTDCDNAELTLVSSPIGQWPPRMRLINKSEPCAISEFGPCERQICLTFADVANFGGICAECAGDFNGVELFCDLQSSDADYCTYTATVLDVCSISYSITAIIPRGNTGTATITMARTGFPTSSTFSGTWTSFPSSLTLVSSTDAWCDMAAATVTIDECSTGGDCSGVPVPTMAGSEVGDVSTATLDVPAGALLIVDVSYYADPPVAPALNSCTFAGHAMTRAGSAQTTFNSGGKTVVPEIWYWVNDTGSTETGEVAHTVDSDTWDTRIYAYEIVECLEFNELVDNEGSSGNGTTITQKADNGTLAATAANQYVHVAIVTLFGANADTDGTYASLTDGGQDYVIDGIMKLCTAHKITTGAGTIDTTKTGTTARISAGKSAIFR